LVCEKYYTGGKKMAKTILIRCVDPRFEGEWTNSVLETLGSHYSLTELGGIDPLGEEGFNALCAKIGALLSINPAIECLFVLCHEDCAWCKAKKINNSEQLNLVCNLSERLKARFPQLKIETGKVNVEGKVNLF
jgi:hypothetical protein